MKKLLNLILIIGMLTSCSSLKNENKNNDNKYNLDEVALKNWEETFSKIIIEKSELEDWYGGDNPINYIARTQKIDQKQVTFLDSLKTKDILTMEEREKFESILAGIVKKLPRKYYLKNENLKNPIGLAKYMTNQSRLRMINPSNRIANKIATQEEWNKIIEFSMKNDLTEKEIRDFRKILNELIKRNNFYDKETWYSIEISPRTMEINKIYEKIDKTDLEKNNVNAKALYIAYSEYFSKLDRWDD